MTHSGSVRSRPTLTLVEFLGAILLGAATVLANGHRIHRNVTLIRRLPILADRSYAHGRASELQSLQLSGRHWQASLDTLISSCSIKSVDGNQSVQTLMIGVDTGIDRSELTRCLENLAIDSADKAIIAAYAGEVWYHLGQVDDAITVWRDWLPPLQRIDKAQRLYDAGHTDTTMLLIKSLDPESRIESGIQRGTVTRILVQAAKESAKSQEFALAEDYWRRAAVQYPERAGYHYNLGITLQRQNRYEEALNSLREAARLQPDNIAYLVRLAMVLEKLGHQAEAEETAQRVLMLEPNNQTAGKLLERAKQD